MRTYVIWICMYACMYVCMYVCIYIRTNENIRYMDMHVCMHACMYIHSSYKYFHTASKRRRRTSNFREPSAPHLTILRRWLLDLASATLAVPKIGNTFL